MTLATLQIDLDGLWTVRRCYGDADAGPADYDAVFHQALPRFLEILGEHRLRATFFIVGQDLEVRWKAELIKAVADAGHEIGNHSYSHRLDLASLPTEEIEDEVTAGQLAIAMATGRGPSGFKAPGYSISLEVLRAVQRQGLLYDASLLPTHWGWLLRGITRWMSRGPSSVSQFSGHWQGAKPLTPFQPLPDAPLWELPVAVSPLLRLPLHSSAGMTFGLGPVRSALRRLGRRNQPLNYTFHGIDLAETDTGQHTDSRLGRRLFGRPYASRERFVRQCIATIADHFEVVTAETTVQRLRETTG